MRGGSLDHHMRWIVVVSAALATRGAAQNRTEASVECAGRLAGAGAAAWARGLSALELRALARTANAPTGRPSPDFARALVRHSPR